MRAEKLSRSKTQSMTANDSSAPIVFEINPMLLQSVEYRFLEGISRLNGSALHRLSRYVGKPCDRDQGFALRTIVEFETDNGCWGGAYFTYGGNIMRRWVLDGFGPELRLYSKETYHERPLSNEAPYLLANEAAAILIPANC